MSRLGAEWIAAEIQRDIDRCETDLRHASRALDSAMFCWQHRFPETPIGSFLESIEKIGKLAALIRDNAATIYTEYRKRAGSGGVQPATR